MREQRLAWADSEASSADGQSATNGHAHRKWAFSAAIAGAVARWLDGVAILLVTIGLCFAAGVDLWNSSFGAALPFALMPVAGVMGVTLAKGYVFGSAQPIAAHLLRVGAGALAAMASMFALVVLTGSLHTGLFMLVCVPNAMTVFALHANYVGLVRTAARNGYLSDDPTR
jgi:hypothetical protein